MPWNPTGYSLNAQGIYNLFSADTASITDSLADDTATKTASGITDSEEPSSTGITDIQTALVALKARLSSLDSWKQSITDAEGRANNRLFNNCHEPNRTTLFTTATRIETEARELEEKTKVEKEKCEKLLKKLEETLAGGTE